MRTSETMPATGARYVVDLETGTVLRAEGLRLVDWDELGDSDRERLDSGVDSDAWDVGYRCGRSLTWELERPAVLYVVNIRRWFDRVNGNSYFGGDVVNVTTGEVLPIPFQYGRGDATYLYAASVAAGVDALTWDEIEPGRIVLVTVEVARQRDARGVGK
jgi:hypothetical protein